MEAGEATERTGLLTSTFRNRMYISRLSIIKFLELVLALIIVYLHHDTFEANSITSLFIITATYAGFCIIIIGTFLGHIFGHPVNRTMDMFFCVVGAILYIASGALAIDHYRSWRFDSSKDKKGLAHGSLAIIQGVIFLIDAFFVYKIE